MVAIVIDARLGMDTQVLIVGAGPTGLTLAIDLGRRGVRCTIIEQKDAPQFLPKMERCNARTMEIYRRMGIAEKIRAAGLPARLPDGRVHRARRWSSRRCCTCPIRRSREAKAQIAATQRRHAAARALSADLAIHARAAAEGGGRDAAERHGALRLRAAVVHAGRGRASPRTVKTRRHDLDDHARTTWSAATAAPAWCASSSASSSPARPTCCSCARRCYCCDDLFERIPIGKGRHYHVADDQATLADRAGFDQAFHPAFRGRQRRRHGDDVRADRRACR